MSSVVCMDSYVSAWQSILPIAKDCANSGSSSSNSKSDSYQQKLRTELRKECIYAFNSRSINSASENYSTGSTYFLKATESPKFPLEHLAQQIFNQHTQGMEFDPTNSGAEWWTQVIHPGDDIGLHWDRDYDLEEEEGIHVHPLFGTVTYLSNLGAPTIVFNKVGSDRADEDILGEIFEVTISPSRFGSHLRFQGNMLHGAPIDIIPPADDEEEEDNDSDDDDEVETVEYLLGKADERRITFLVNIWIDHIPSQSKRYKNKQAATFNAKSQPILLDFNNGISESDIKSLKVKSQDSVSSTLNDSNIVVIENKQSFLFNNSDIRFEVAVQLPSRDTIKSAIETSPLVRLSYDSDVPILLKVSLDQDYSEDEEEDFDEYEEGNSYGSDSGEEDTRKRGRGQAQVVPEKDRTSNKKSRK